MRLISVCIRDIVEYYSRDVFFPIYRDMGLGTIIMLSVGTWAFYSIEDLSTSPAYDEYLSIIDDRLYENEEPFNIHMSYMEDLFIGIVEKLHARCSQVIGGDTPYAFSAWVNGTTILVEEILLLDDGVTL